VCWRRRHEKLVALRCAGFNNVDLAAAARAGITVVRVPAYSPHAVASTRWR
jgi:D-lactate dehydrogenase